MDGRRWARTAQGAAIVGGICFAIFVAGLVTAVPGRLRIAWGATGVIAGVAGALVGVFPMDDLAPRSAAALTFFVLGWLTVLLASLDTFRLRDAGFPRWLTVIAAMTTAPSSCSWPRSSRISG